MSNDVRNEQSHSGNVIRRIGFGAAPIGNLYCEQSEQDAFDAVKSACEVGIRYFDTAPYYGFGLSEKRLGVALDKIDDASSVSLSTKVGRRLRPIYPAETKVRYGFARAENAEPYFDYSYEGVMSSFESSLERLKVDKVDSLFVHDLGVETHGDKNAAMLDCFYEGGYKAMQELKRSGLTNKIGIGLNECRACVEINQHVDFDVVLLAGRYTLLDQSAVDEVFPLCVKKNISIVLGGVFNSGILATGVKQKDVEHYYNYLPASSSIKTRVRRIEDICEQFLLPLPAVAIQFVLLNRDVDRLLVGLANKEQTKQILKYLQFQIPEEFWTCLVDEKLITFHPGFFEGVF